MLTIRTVAVIMFLSVASASFATNDAPAPKAKNNTATTAVATKSTGSSYAFKIDNSINKNNQVDSVLVILDKFDHTGAGIVRKVFYPNAENKVIIDELPAGKYYAEIYVLGIYKKHFSTVINTEKITKKNKLVLPLDYTDVYVPGSVNIPAENPKSFSYSK
jgi:hypothetical protein